MSQSKFENFLNENIKQESSTVDWNDERDRWLRYLDEFYNTIEEFLEPYKDRLDIKKEDHEIYEEKLGCYIVKKMTIDIGGKKATFTPIGTILIAAYGRVDLQGQFGSVKFVLVPEDSKGPIIKIFINDDNAKDSKDTHIDKNALSWKIATPPPNIKYYPLTKESLEQRILDVMGA